MKRGQAGNIATLISLIALFMLVYILLLPQETRDDLLQREGDRTGFLNEDVVEGLDLLFSKNIGDVSPLRQSRGILHTLSGVNLFTDVENEIVTLANDIKFSRSVASENSQEVTFPLEFPGDVNKAELYVVVGDVRGDMIVVLNGREIFNSDVESNTQEIIQLPLSLLTEVNIVEFKSANPGGLFWQTNEHKLREVRLRKQVEIKNRISERVISIPASETKDLEKAVLSFSVFCSQNERDLLILKVNGKRVYSDVPFCNLRRVEIEIDRDFVKSGSNDIIFETDGDYIIEEVEWQSLLKGERASEYAFDIDIEAYKNVRRGSSDVFLVFDFALSDDRKAFDIYVNGEKFEVSTLDDTHTIIISDFLENGSNLLRLRPRNSFEIIEMRVELE
jgi:hypothetical protein